MNQPSIDQTIPVSRSAKGSDLQSALKTEIISGRSTPRPASSRWRNMIASNFVISIGSRIQRSKYEVYVNDMRVRFGSNSICVPSVVVVSGEPEFADDKGDLLLNPTALIEIFSSGTRAMDFTQKLEGFLAIPKLKECLLVNEHEMRIEHYSRQNPKQWIYRIYNEREDKVDLESVGCKLAVSEIYSQVKLVGSTLNSQAVN